jgi:hypothetical protein
MVETIAFLSSPLSLCPMGNLGTPSHHQEDGQCQQREKREHAHRLLRASQQPLDSRQRLLYHTDDSAWSAVPPRCGCCRLS